MKECSVIAGLISCGIEIRGTYGIKLIMIFLCIMLLMCLSEENFTVHFRMGVVFATTDIEVNTVN
jgi:hypothetical protein